MKKFLSPKAGIVLTIVVILIITVLEFPAPVGFETRPQNNVSLGWLVFFLTIVIAEIATIPLILKKPKTGSITGMIAGTLNILQVSADQLHLLQPEVAPFGYTILEYSVALASIILIYLSFKFYKTTQR